SDTPFEGATIRNPKPLGISRAKNQCLEYAREMCYSHIFLADDDVYSLKGNILYKYINSGFSHMCLSYEKDITGRRISNEVYVSEKYTNHLVYNAPCGLLLYCDELVLDSGVTYPEMPGRWGLEHRVFSERIHKAGLNPY